MTRINRSEFLIKPFLKRNNFKAFFQISSTLLPIITLWLLIYQIKNSGFLLVSKISLFVPILCLLTLFSARTFSLMHDCGHNSLFEKRKLNNLFGFFLGVLNGIPQTPWSADHAFHHRNNGNWQIYKGPIDVLDLDDYQNLSAKEQFFYKLSRSWLMLFPGGFFYLVIKPRLVLILIIFNLAISILKETFTKIKERNFSRLFHIKSRVKSPFSDYGENFRELVDLFANNIIVLFVWVLMSKWLGAFFFITFYSLTATFSAAILICIFFVQHNYEDTYAKNTKNWNIVEGAIYGSSNLNVPNWLNWFLADISFHSIHHLSERIPNYNLKECHQANINLLNQSKLLNLTDFPKCFKYIIWDSQKEKLIPIN